MPLSFPNSPTEGQVYTDTPSGNRWVWDSANTVWKSTSTFTQTITVASTAPGTPVIGQLWWNQDYGRLLVYYNDGTSSQWVDASPSDATGVLAYGQANLVFGVANAAYGKANIAFQNTSGTLAGDLSITGNVGIGTSSPGTFGKFAVQTQSAYQPTIAIGAPGGSLSPQINHYITDSTNVLRNLNQIAFYTGSSDISNYQGYMTFSTMPSAGTLTERMRIDSSGNLGIGTSSPTGRLDVASRGITKGSMPSGSILQVVSTTKTDTFTTSVNMSASGGSWTSTGSTVTGLTATITPTSSSSKILVMVTLNGTGTAGYAQIYCLLYRDSTIIGSPAPSSAKPGVMARNYATDNNVVNGTCGFTYLDSPGSTSSITYSIKVGGENSSAVYVNQPANNNDATNGARMSSTITVMEIAQ